MKNLVLLDDQFPIRQIGEDDTKSFGEEAFKEMLLLTDQDWSYQGYLKTLVNDILESRFMSEQLIKLSGYCHPEFLLQSIESEGFKPDVIIYDWEYMTGSDNSDSNLLSILNQTNTFIFIYSNLPTEKGLEHIPKLIGDSNFDIYSHRIQLLAKGDQEASVFGSEGFILQYINSLFYENYKINLGAHTIEFEKSGYITNASDILYLETIFGKEFLLNELQNINNRINSKTVIQLFERSQGKLFINKNKTTLVIRQTERIERMYGALLPISYADVLNNFGLRKLVDVIERGATNLN